MGGLGRRAPCWPAKRQKMRAAPRFKDDREASFLLPMWNLKGAPLGCPPSFTCDLCEVSQARSRSIHAPSKLTFCPGKPFSLAEAGAPWIEEKTEAVIAEDMQRTFPKYLPTAPAWAKQVNALL